MGPAKKLVSGILGGGEAPAPVITPPPIIPPPEMPTPNGEAAKKAKRRSLAAQLGRQGRQSTILSDAVTSNETLG
jgi:hypothetical protein